MGAFVGTTFAIDGINTARRFRLWRTSGSQPYWASNTAQGAGRKCGNRDWRGRYWCYGHTPAYFPGDGFTFQAVTDEGQGLQGTAIVERVQIFWNFTEGAYIAHVVEFARNGALTFTATATDVEQPADYIHCTEGTKFVYSGITLPEVQAMMLDIQCANRPRVTSSTNGGVVRARGNLDASWGVQNIEHDPSQYPLINTNHDLRFYVDASTYWALNWGYILRTPNEYGADHESLDYVGGRLEGAWNAHLTSATGSIITPAGVTKWPYP